jgi:TBCC domain-containing protein 1
MARYRLWLNWEVFEAAVIHPLFPQDISMEKIGQVASVFPDVTQILTFDEWKTRVATLFKLTSVQTEAIYTTLTVFVAHDPLDALSQTRTYPSLTCSIMRVTDILVFLYALFVKRKFRTVGERANLEAYPRKPASDGPALARPKNMSYSQPTISLPLMGESNQSAADSGYESLEGFLLSKFPAFLRIYSPNGLTPTHVHSLGLVLQGGPTLAMTKQELADAMNLFRGKAVESVDGFYRSVRSALTARKEAETSIRALSELRSPVSYRPICDHCPASGKAQDLGVYDEPLYIDQASTFEGFIVENPNRFCDVYINGCRHRTIYFCAAARVVFVSHCKDSLIFVGAATAVHVESCANLRILVATRLFHIDSSVQSTVYLQTNTKPIVTGSCANLVLAPYNALYRKASLDMLVVGINPQLNLWNQPVILASLGVTPPRTMEPELFTLFSVPFTWGDIGSQFTPQLPPAYVAGLQARQASVLKLKKWLDMIQDKDPGLFEKLQEHLKVKSDASIKETGQDHELVWLGRLEEQLRGCEELA